MLACHAPYHQHQRRTCKIQFCVRKIPAIFLCDAKRNVPDLCSAFPSLLLEPYAYSVALSGDGSLPARRRVSNANYARRKFCIDVAVIRLANRATETQHAVTSANACVVLLALSKGYLLRLIDHDLFFRFPSKTSRFLTSNISEYHLSCALHRKTSCALSHMSWLCLVHEYWRWFRHRVMEETSRFVSPLAESQRTMCHPHDSDPSFHHQKHDNTGLKTFQRLFASFL